MGSAGICSDIAALLRSLTIGKENNGTTMAPSSKAIAAVFYKVNKIEASESSKVPGDKSHFAVCRCQLEGFFN